MAKSAFPKGGLQGSLREKLEIAKFRLKTKIAKALDKAAGKLLASATR